MVVSEGRQHLGAVADGYGDGLLLAVAEEADLNGRSGLARGDVVYQVVAVLYRLAVDGGDDVSRLEPALSAEKPGWTLLTSTPFLKPYTCATAGAGSAGR